MSKSTTWIIVAVIVVVLLGGGVWWWNMSQNQSSSNPAPQAQNNLAAQQQPVAVNPSPTNTVVPPASQLPSGNSDQAINQELNDTNSQLNGLSSDSASINQGLSDQPVQQSQL